MKKTVIFCTRDKYMERMNYLKIREKMQKQRDRESVQRIEEDVEIIGIIPIGRNSFHFYVIFIYPTLEQLLY